MAFTAQDVKNLREQTGCGMMDCKKALTEADGNFEKAIEYLREKGLAAAQKKASRIAAEGMVYASYCSECKVGVILEVNAETDFVAKNEMFQTFVKDVADVIAKQAPADVEALLACKMGDDTVEAALKDKILVIGENIKIRRFARYEGVCAAYIHAGGTHAVLVNFETSDEVAAKAEFAAYGKDIAMQIAAANPGYVCESEVPASVIEKEKEILLAQIANDPKNANKPDAIKEKMVLGRIGKFYKENCLVDQEFVKDPDLSVSKYTEKVGKELGGEIKIVKFVRYEKGEGLEKREDNFAEEIANMVK
ncbi:translation elongation factor Ts [Gemmiger sp. An120]|uniref:Elongation factor Ts n=1 Tax=Candidatus Allofournierella merdipullorum TaxID=2838595 RepID=A0A9D2E5B4_9FIRM|nr:MULTISPECIES: translation elongation factor Ts [Gemmiger]MBM6915067.1 elongation factor Ts [Gemmiger formicilis]OUQ44023.1 translation elongation factor Ts [Gemmiger sp. An120]HIZ31095.1 translation elongation factor Ts [Candidatus Fournierella merdipullorum]